MKTGLALRSTVFGPSLIARLVPMLDDSGVDSVWFPSVGRAFDSLDMAGISLGASDRLKVGTGVIRSADYDPGRLLSRVHTLSEGSGGRFVLGVGTGSQTGRGAIDSLVHLAGGLRASYPEKRRPPIFFAALKRRMLSSAYLNADGAILNFCPPDYVSRITPGDLKRKEGFTLACYIKLFFARDGATASKMLAEEFRMYYEIPQYRAMFEEIGAAEAIHRIDPGRPVPEELQAISLANPSDDEVSRILEGFRKAGADLPILYPYVSGDDDYKEGVVERLASRL